MSRSMPQLRLRWLPSKRILVFSRCISTRGRRWIAHYELNTWEMISSTQIYAKFACKSSVAHHCWRWYLAIDDAEDRFSNQGVYDEKIQEFQQNAIVRFTNSCGGRWIETWELRLENYLLSDALSVNAITWSKLFFSISHIFLQMIHRKSFFSSFKIFLPNFHSEEKTLKWRIRNKSWSEDFVHAHWHWWDDVS